MAHEQHLDLVEVSDKADPPVCRIMNYDKFRYELKKKQQEARKNRSPMKRTLSEWLDWQETAHDKAWDLGLKRVGTVWQALDRKIGRASCRERV